ncbi:MAG: toxin-antitoxin system HicB family antitoxin [Candidatus Eisenbacteria bacterium]|nr:toxin-antitoxin system HicB family antitoxin [Candidatus Eisenbacteria bacterium]
MPEPDAIPEYSGQFRLRIPRSLHAWLAYEAQRQRVSLNSLVASILSRARGSIEARGGARPRADPS